MWKNHSRTLLSSQAKHKKEESLKIMSACMFFWYKVCDSVVPSKDSNKKVLYEYENENETNILSNVCRGISLRSLIGNPYITYTNVVYKDCVCYTAAVMGERYFGKRQLDCSFAFDASGELLINHALQAATWRRCKRRNNSTCRMCQAFYIALQNYSHVL